MNHITLQNTTTVFFYIIVSILSIISINIAYRSKTRLKKYIALIVTILILAIPQMIRFDVGADFLMFFQKYSKLCATKDFYYVRSRNYEEISAAVIYYLSWMTLGNVQGAFAFYSLLTQFFMVLGIWNFRKYVNPGASMLLYVCQDYWRTYNLFRQSLAVAIVFYALIYLKNNQVKKYIVFVCIAAVFHNSAIIAIVLIFFFNKTIIKNKFMENALFFICPIIILIAVIICFDYFKQLPLLGQYIKDVYTKQNHIAFSIGYLILFPKMILYYLFVHNNKNSIYRKDERLNIIFDRVIYFDVLFNFFAIFLTYAARIGLYFYCSRIVSFAQLYGHRRFTKKATIYRLGVLIYALVMFYSTMKNNGLKVIPYSFIY